MPDEVRRGPRLIGSRVRIGSQVPEQTSKYGSAGIGRFSVAPMMDWTCC